MSDASSPNEPTRRGRALGRRVLASVLVAVASLSFFVAGLLNVGNALAGSPRQLANTVLSVTTNPSVRSAVANEVVNQIQKDVGPSARTTFDPHRRALVTAVESVISSPEAQRVARGVLEALDGASSTGHDTVDLRPLLARFTSVMHTVDPSISPTPVNLNNSVVTVSHSTSFERALGSFFKAELTFVVIGLVALTLAAGLLIRGERARYLAIGLAFADPGLFFLVIGRASVPAARHLAYGNVYERSIVVAAVRRVSGTVTATGVALLVLGVVAMGAWIVGRCIRALRATSVSSEEAR